MQKIKLRNNPVFEIYISEDSFELRFEKESDINGVYKFSKTDSLRIDKRINWFFSIFATLFEFILTTGGAGLYKERDLLMFNYNNEPIRTKLNGCDLPLAKLTIDAINQKIGETNKQNLLSDYSSHDL